MTKKDDINFDYNEEVKKCKTIDDVIGKDGLVQRLIKDVLENILEVEMGEHLGRDKYDRQTDIDQDDRNYRNGYRRRHELSDELADSRSGRRLLRDHRCRIRLVSGQTGGGKEAD